MRKDQEAAQAIIDRRQKDLTALQESAKQTSFRQQRDAAISENDSQRRRVYTRQLWIIAVVCGIVFVCLLVRYFLPDIPKVVTSAIMAIAFGVGSVMVLRNLILLNSRDPANFQELAIAPPDASDGTGGAAITDKPPGDKDGDDKDDDETALPPGSCMNAACCDGVNTIWHPATAKCIPVNKVETFVQHRTTAMRRPEFAVSENFAPEPFDVRVGIYNQPV